MSVPLYGYEIETLNKRGYSNITPTTFDDRPALKALLASYEKELALTNVSYFLADFKIGDKDAANSTTDGRVAGDERFIIISRKMAELLNDKELSLVIGHEQNHAKHLLKHKVMATLSSLPTWTGAAAGGISGAGISSAVIGILAAAAWLKHKMSAGHRDDAKETPKAPPAIFSRRNFLKVAASTAAGASLGALGKANLLSRKKVGAQIEADCDDMAATLVNDPAVLLSAAQKLEAHYQDIGVSLSDAHGHRPFAERASSHLR